MALVLSSGAMAQVLPGPADISRIKPEERLPAIEYNNNQQPAIPSIVPPVRVPEAAKAVHVVLHEVHIEGVTAFSPEQLRDIYAAYLDKDITLDAAYTMAGAITERYRNAGYFLSVAYVPNQHIKDGIITIRVAEGYIGEVELDDALRSRHVIAGYIDRLVAQRPLLAEALESFLLRLNDLPGLSFRAVLSPLQGEEGAVKLVLVPTDKSGKGSISFDNFSSRYLGPDEATLSYTASILPLQQTTVSGLSAIPPDKLRYATLAHSIAIFPDISLEFAGNYTKAHPGYTLEPENIESNSEFLGADIAWQWLRQRQQNLLFKLTLDGRNSNTDILDTPLVKDHVRALRASASYDVTDSWLGANTANLTISRGVNGLGSSEPGERDLSHAQARPDFAKAELALSRLQTITDNWSLLLSADGQTASGTLYSSEEFGYGGQAFGRAYDASAITGDRGVDGAVELRYSGLNPWQKLTLQPYGFYDIGVVWNDAIAEPKEESGASAGFGLRATTAIGLSGMVGIAWPLTREIVAPLYGEGHRDPRLSMQISQDF